MIAAAFVPASCLTLATTPLLAEDWREFRGPGGQGQSQASDLPTSWGAEQHIRWKSAIAGKGWSSPIIDEGRIFLTTAVPSEETPPERQSLRAMCLDAATGKILWDKEVFSKSMSDAKNHTKNSFASPTPITDGKHIFVHFGPDGTACLDRDGETVWSNAALNYNPQHGAGGSPIFADNLLVFHSDGATDPFIVALERDGGAVAWKTARPEMPDPKFSFATPLLLEAEGRRQLVSPASHMVCSYAPDSGEELWRVRYPNKWSVVPRPVFSHGLVFVCTGYDGPAELLAIRPTGLGDVTETHIAWKTDDNVPHNPSPVVVGDAIYLVADNGIASCRDVATGTLHWRQRLGGNFSSSLVHAGGRLYIISEQGVCTVFAADPSAYKELGTSDMGEQALASLAPAEGAIFLRTEGHLYRIE
ncbi:MAG: serine/threonine protein kinase [Planctomycetota bacterium]|nr:MAG: serine/threonine protein kinase [Planctomycetota bacterium]